MPILESQRVRRALRPPIACLALAWLWLPAAARASGAELVLLPHVPPSTDLDFRLMFALIAVFVLLIAPTHRLIFKPLLRVLDEREARTAGTRVRAARIEEEAREVLARYEGEVAKTREEAERSRRTTLEQVRGESQQLAGAARGAAEQSQAAARRELADALEGARRVLRDRTQELAREAASRVLGRTL
jgi:F-type H+-transporting ATPase subunit b